MKLFFSISFLMDCFSLLGFCHHVPPDLCHHYAADTALHIVSTWWQCAPNILSALPTGITKTHNLHFQETEALQAVFASHLCPSVLKAPARLAAHCSLSRQNLNFLLHTEQTELQEHISVIEYHPLLRKQNVLLRP